VDRTDAGRTDADRTDAGRTDSAAGEGAPASGEGAPAPGRGNAAPGELVLRSPAQFRALGHPLRHRLFNLLRQRPATLAQLAAALGSTKGKLFVVTVDQPQRLQVCHIQSFTLDKLVCSRPIGSPRVYLPQQILAVILPGDDDLKLRLVLGLNGGLGAAIWGTVVLAAACPACAVATGIAAFFFFGAAGAVLIGDDQPNRLLYLAPGQQLSPKLGYIER